jgi:hypothetical protein
MEPKSIELKSIIRRENLMDIAIELDYKTGAEIGVLNGDFAGIVTSKWTGKWILVDPWKHFDQGYIDPSNFSDEEHENRYQAVLNKLSGRNINVIRKESVEASKDLTDGCLDFVYIDANHSYKAVTDDLEAWWPKVAIGGIISGHDYMDRIRPKKRAYNCLVRSAVNDFIQRKQLQLPYLTQPTCCPSWVLVKPRTADDVKSGWVNFARPIERTI